MHPRLSFRRALPIAAALAFATALAAPTVAPAATGSGAALAPDVLVGELHATILDGAPGDDLTTTNLHWKGASRYRAVTHVAGTQPFDSFGDWNNGVFTGGTGFPKRASDAVRTVRSYSVSPDSYDPLSSDLIGWGEPLLEVARNGGARLQVASWNGHRVLRGTMRVASNECAGLRKGLRTVDFDPRTLVPVHIQEQRHAVVTLDKRITLHARVAGAFAALHIAGRVDTTDDGFIRSTPAQAAAILGFPVAMPVGLPATWHPDFAGHASIGATIGPEASFAKANGLFAARWSRGTDPLELTIRGGNAGLVKDWDESDPSGGECSAEVAGGDVTVTGATGPAHWSIPEFGATHLWWRTGTTLYELAAPVGRDELVAIANSLTVVPKG